MAADERHHFLGRGASPDADKKQISFLDEIGITKVIVCDVGARADKGTTDTAFDQFMSGEFGQRLPGVIFILANDEDHVRPGITFEMEGIATKKIHAGDGRTPEFFDMLNNEIGAGKMAYMRWHAGVIHRIDEVAHEDYILTAVDHLTDRKGATKDAHVAVHAHDDEVGYAALLHQIIRFGGVGNGINVFDFQRVDLMGPWPARLA